MTEVSSPYTWQPQRTVPSPFHSPSINIAILQFIKTFNRIYIQLHHGLAQSCKGGGEGGSFLL